MTKQLQFKKWITFLAFFLISNLIFSQDPFITVWEVDASDTEITIPTTGSGYNYNVVWIEIGNSSNNGSLSGRTGDTTIDFGEAGTYGVGITGSFPSIFFNNEGDKDKIIEIDSWGDIVWGSMENAFAGCSNLTITATDNPNLSQVTSMAGMFREASSMNAPIGSWNVSNVQDMSNLFFLASSFNQDIGSWNVSNVTNMYRMFNRAQSFNQDIGNWDVSNVTDMSEMFVFNQVFDQDLSAWNIGNVTNMSFMFQNATNFNSDVSNWDVSAVTNMNSLFVGATRFNQNLGNWDISQVNDMTDMLKDCGLSTPNYDSTLIGWNTLDTGETQIPINITLGAERQQYCLSETARSELINTYGWNILEDELDPLCTVPFITEWETTTTNEQITIPTVGNQYDYTVYWGDGTFDTDLNGDATHTYADPGRYTVTIVGAFPQIYFNGITENSRKIKEVIQWGGIQWRSMEDAFHGCTTLHIGATDAPDLSQVTSLARMFKFCSVMNADLSEWDVSNITNMSGLFEGALAFNSFINTWNTTNVTDMSYLFSVAESFNQILDNWDVSNVKNMEGMLNRATNFNQNLSNWNVGNVTNMRNLFQLAESFNQLLDSWDVSKVTDMTGMFQFADKFNQSLSSWDVSSVTEMNSMFDRATVFNQDVGGWDVSSVTDMASMFRGASSFNQDIQEWDVSNVTSMENMFAASIAFNQEIGDWDVSKVTNLSSMFDGATSFNQDLSNWDVSSVIIMNRVFANASNFDQDLGNWDISSLNQVFDMLAWSGLSIANYDSLLIGWSTLDTESGETSIPTNLFLGATGLKFCSGAAARNTLTDTFNWGIFDSGFASNCPSSFITEWELNSANEEVFILADSRYVYNYTIDWGDGTFESSLTGNASHTYSGAGTYQIQILGQFPSPYFYGDSRVTKVVQWGDIEWVDLNASFGECYNLVVTAADAPNLSQATSLIGTFANCPLHDWDNQSLSSWDVSTITDMTSLFSQNREVNDGQELNLDLSSWNVSNVTDMSYMFFRVGSVKVGLNNWDLSNVETIEFMFMDVGLIQDDISGWNTESVNNMGNAFRSAGFNPDIENWDVSAVTDMTSAFRNNSSFDKDLSNWDVGNVTDMTDIFSNSGLSISNYDNILIGWSQLPGLKSNVKLGAQNLTYCNAEAERLTLINDFNWNITDAGKDLDCSAFITTWQTTVDNETITIPTTGAGYNYRIDWGDGTINNNLTGNTSHTYASAGTHTIKINGQFPRIYFSNIGDKDKLISIDQWGDQQWTSMERAFIGCTNLTVPALDAPDLSQVTNMRQMFTLANSLVTIPAADQWDVSNVENMEEVFSATSLFNGDISTWDVSNVTNMSLMFNGALAFNQDISEWNVNKVENMSFMFAGASSFDQSLGDWDISSLTDASRILEFSNMSTANYDQTLIGWNTLNTNVGETQIPMNVNLGAEGVTFCEGQNARSNLQVTYNWVIQDGGFDASCSENLEGAFVTTWRTTTSNELITIPTTGSGYDYTVYWGDGTYDENVVGDISHTYTGAGTYKVQILGDFSRIFFNGNASNASKLISVEQWGAIAWQSMANAFQGCVNMNVVATDVPDLSGISSMQEMFVNCHALNANLNNWDVSTVTNMSLLFSGATTFNGPLNSWDVSKVSDMSRMFFNTEVFNQPLNDWDVSSVTTMQSMFARADLFNQPVNNWNVSSVISMRSMFDLAIAFNQPLNSWDVSNVEDMISMFEDASSFNQPLNSWDVSKLTLMQEMFEGATSFNQPLSNWDVSSVVSSFGMFEDAVAFNQPLDNWDMSNVVFMRRMFKRANTFNQNLGDWDISKVSDMRGMFEEAGLSTENYDATLIGWATDSTGSIDGIDDIPSDIDFDGGLSTFCQSEDARNMLTNDFNWTILDGMKSLDCPIEGAFVMQWQISPNVQITIPTTGTGYDYTVIWGDGIIDSNLTGDATHTYTEAGIYTVQITGDFPRIFFNGFSDNSRRLLNILQWGDIQWASMDRAFFGCREMDLLASDTPDLTGVTSLKAMFRECRSFNGDLSGWDVAGIENMNSMFFGAAKFNQPLNSWNVSNLENMAVMFADALSFNQPLNSWDVSGVTDMSFAFDGATSFDQPLDNWKVGQVVRMQGMFLDASEFNQPLNNWDVSEVRFMTDMFGRATSFNQPLDDWDLSSEPDMEDMFREAGLSTENYDTTLAGWAIDSSGAIDGVDDIPSNITFDGGNSTYCLAAGARNDLDITFNWDITDAGLDANCEPGLLLDINVYLEGAGISPNSGEESLMRDDLRVMGMIPVTSPYGDGLIADASVFSTVGTDAIVDWVWVELRDEDDSSLVIESRSALLQRDGDIVDIDGTSSLEFGSAFGNYFVAINHRNHLGIISSTAIEFNTAVTTIDFTSDVTSVEGGANALTLLENGEYAIYSGDFDGNEQVQNTDVNGVISLLGNSGYSDADMDANAQVQNTDINNVIFPSLGRGQQFVTNRSVAAGQNNDTEITFTFDNAQITSDNGMDYYEVDVMIAASEAFKLGSGQLYINYSPDAFGTNIEANGKLEFTQPDGSILGEVYSGFPAYKDFIDNDNIDSRISLSFQQGVSSGTITDNNVTATPSVLFHLKIEYLDAGLDPGICFETDPVFLDQFFTASGPTTFGFPDPTNFPGEQLFNDQFNCDSASPNTLGVTDLDIDQLGLYPNPAHGEVYIKGLRLEAEILIYDINGKLVNKLNNYREGPINITDLEAGVYLVQVISESATNTLRLLKNKD